MKLEDYSCTNRAYHTGSCCDTCWNKHPEAKLNESFLHSERRKEIVYQFHYDEFMRGALNVEFTVKQAIFLFNKFFPGRRVK